MTITMMIISWFSDSLSFSLAIVTMVTISTIVAVSMMVVSGFSDSFSLSVISMMAISTIMTVSMVVVAWISNSSTKNCKRYSNKNIHDVDGFNSSETPPC